METVHNGLLVVVALLSLCCQSCVGDVIIGEMLHASGFRKRITLRNTGHAAEQLSEYALNVYFNPPSTTVRRLDPISDTATLEPAEEFAICYSRSPEACDVRWGGLNFNGNDAIELTRNGVRVDVIGNDDGRGVVGGGWAVGSIPAATQHHLLTRKTSVQTGSLDWTQSSQSEWIVESTAEACDSTSHAVFDDKCWTIRSQLSSFPLDSCASRTQKQSVVVGTYNAFWLFDGVDDPRAQDEWRDATAARRHLQKIADVIRRHKPDILTLAEVEDEEILKDLVQEIADPVYTPYFVKGRDSGTGQDVALITRGDLVWNLTRTDCRSGQVAGSTCGAHLCGTQGVSKNQIALFDSCLFGVKFALISLHLLAHPTAKQRCVERESQARVIQDVINQLTRSGFEVIVAGDLNDYSDKYDDVYTSAGPTSRVLSMLRDPNGDGIDELDNVMQHLPQGERYTSWWDRSGDDEYPGIEEATQIDHILMTKRLFERIQRVWIDHELDPEVVSDHRPLFVELATHEPQATQESRFNTEI